jgi:hypothetical protein
MTERERDWSKVRRGINEGRMGRPLKNKHGVRNVEVMVRVNEAEKAWLLGQCQEGEAIASAVRRMIAAHVPPDTGLFVDQEVPGGNT